MEFLPPYSQEAQPTPSGDHSLHRSRSVELRAGKFYPRCECIKRNGLQHECRRTDCQGKSGCMSKSGPTCNPGSYAQRMMKYNTSDGRQKVRDVKMNKLADSKHGGLSEMPIVASNDLSEFKDMDPKMFNQIYSNTIPASSYPQYNGAPIMGQPLQSFDQNFGGVSIGSNGQPMSVNTPAMGSNQSNGQSKVMGQQATSNLPVINAQPVLSPVPQSFAMEPMPVLQQMPVNGQFASPGVPIVQGSQQFTIPGQALTPYSANMNSYSSYTPNLTTYFPCSPSNMPTLGSGIPCETAQ